MVDKFLLYGVPGVGKSTIASGIAERNNYIYLELDFLRPKAQEIVARDEEPFVYEYSTEAWKKFGELNKNNAVKGFLAVREAFSKYIDSELSFRGANYVAEAVYIDPSKFLKQDTKVNLVITSNEELHYSHFFLHREHSNEEDTQFKAARYIQEYLIEEAEKLDIEIIDNK